MEAPPARADVIEFRSDGTTVVHTKRARPMNAVGRVAGATPVSERAEPYRELVNRTAAAHGIDAGLVMAVMRAESDFDKDAVSPKGAKGLMQLMPATADRFGVGNAFDPASNIEGGVRYLRWLMDRYDGDLALALAGYNAGEGAVDRHKGVPPYPETHDYLARVGRFLARDILPTPGEGLAEMQDRRRATMPSGTGTSRSPPIVFDHRTERQRAAREAGRG